jgi:hypothetical protein
MGFEEQVCTLINRVAFYKEASHCAEIWINADKMIDDGTI